MNKLFKILPLLGLLLCGGLAHAQVPPAANNTLCAPAVPCTPVGPVNTGTGDQWFEFGARYNQQDDLILNMFGPSSHFAATGTVAATDISAIFGCGGNPLLVLNGAGGCTAGGGGGSTPALPAFSLQFNGGAGALGGLLPSVPGIYCTQWVSTSGPPDLANCPGGGSVLSVTITAFPGITPVGCVITTSGVCALTTTLSGVLFGTGSGFSTAVAANIAALWGGTCNSSTFLRGDGTCATPTGAGTVTTSGSPGAGSLTGFSGSTAITNVNLSGDCVTAGALATTCGGAATQFIAVTSACPLNTTNTSATANAVSSPLTCTLPTAVGDVHTYCVTKTDSTGNTVTVATTSAQTIQGNANEIIQFKGNTMCVRSDNANWWIVNLLRNFSTEGLS